MLIIEENAEELGFAVKEKSYRKRGEKIYPFHQSISSRMLFTKRTSKEGVAWLQHLYKSKASGCLMADDMGLGKTLQILYFIDWHSRKYADHKPYLIVAPVSLLENWKMNMKDSSSKPRMTINMLTSKDVPRKFDKDIVNRIQKDGHSLN